MTAPAWGVPWHGRVEGGLLHLPNGATMPWPQPDGTLASTYPADKSKWMPDHAGYTHLIKMPGTVELLTSAEDQAAGKRWLDRAILAGASDSDGPKSRLHSKAVLGWIYAAPDGSRWQIVSLGRYRWLPAGLTRTLSPRRFGVLGGAEDMYNYSVTITTAQMGQAAWSNPGDVRYAQVEAISQAGDRAIFMLYKAGQKEWPLGFLLLTLSGTPGVDFSATLEPLRTAEQTTGTVTESPLGYALMHGRVTQEVTSEVVDGTSITTKVYTWELVADAPTGTIYRAYNGTATSSLTGRIVAMYFDAGDAPREVTISINRATTLNIPFPTVAIAGQDRYYTLAPEPYLERATQTYSIASSRTDSDVITLSNGMHSVTLSTTSSWSVSCSGSGDTAGGTATESVSASVNVDGWTQNYIVDRPRETDGFSRWMVTVTAANPTVSASAGDIDIRTLQVDIPGADYVQYLLRIKRWSNNLIGLVALRNPSAGDSTIKWSSALCPGTPAPADSETSAAVTAESAWHAYRPFGAWNPIDDEALIASEAPISWT